MRWYSGCCGTQQFICLTGPKLLLLGPPSPTVGAVSPPLNVSCWEYPLERLLAILFAYQGLKGLVFFFIIPELGHMAPEPETRLRVVGNRRGKFWSSGAVSGSVLRSPSQTWEPPVLLGAIVSLKSCILDLCPGSARLNSLGAQIDLIVFIDLLL